MMTDKLSLPAWCAFMAGMAYASRNEWMYRARFVADQARRDYVKVARQYHYDYLSRMRLAKQS